MAPDHQVEGMWIAHTEREATTSNVSWMPWRMDYEADPILEIDSPRDSRIIASLLNAIGAKPLLSTIKHRKEGM